MTTARRAYYRNKRDAKIFGVGAGLADYLGIDALWVRVALVMLTLLGAGILIPLYFIVAFLASRRPEDTAGDRGYDEEERAYQRARSRGTRSRVRSDLSDMGRRLADIESQYASNGRLSDEIERLR